MDWGEEQGADALVQFVFDHDFDGAVIVFAVGDDKLDFVGLAEQGQIWPMVFVTHLAGRTLDIEDMYKVFGALFKADMAACFGEHGVTGLDKPGG